MTKETKTKYFDFLEGLRRTGKINMFGAAPYLAKAFGIPVAEARTILSEWMRG